ncbi:hypothetical protein BpHYR1_020055 [Brachionus plicatilis]|uniref:Uncharacterized protein n=1 Tax=Brachionus plicatilis TaxID=10195 RepID=A0A3M7QYA4_BRAPC|nr:hypothetical protein BpHYR1_020055 [Brachionus plicatilis]
MQVFFVVVKNLPMSHRISFFSFVVLQIREPLLLFFNRLPSFLIIFSVYPTHLSFCRLFLSFLLYSVLSLGSARRPKSYFFAAFLIGFTQFQLYTSSYQILITQRPPVGPLPSIRCKIKRVVKN